MTPQNLRTRRGKRQRTGEQEVAVVDLEVEEREVDLEEDGGGAEAEDSRGNIG